jgi:hypothetical protein
VVTKATINRLSARIDAIVTARKPPGGRQVVIMWPCREDDDVTNERHCAAHPDDRGAGLYVLLTQFTMSSFLPSGVAPISASMHPPLCFMRAFRKTPSTHM